MNIENTQDYYGSNLFQKFLSFIAAILFFAILFFILQCVVKKMGGWINSFKIMGISLAVVITFSYFYQKYPEVCKRVGKMFNYFAWMMLINLFLLEVFWLGLSMILYTVQTITNFNISAIPQPAGKIVFLTHLVTTIVAAILVYKYKIDKRLRNRIFKSEGKNNVTLAT